MYVIMHPWNLFRPTKHDLLQGSWVASPDQSKTSSQPKKCTWAFVASFPSPELTRVSSVDELVNTAAQTLNAAAALQITKAKL